MRSIGKKNRNLVVRVTEEVIQEGVAGISNITETVVSRLPVELWDTWEMADQEIRRIVGDHVGASMFERSGA